jgi:hypothetical protein
MPEPSASAYPRTQQKIEAIPADWNQEIQNFLTERIKQIELLKTLQELDSQPDKTKANSTALIREDRERQEQSYPKRRPKNSQYSKHDNNHQTPKTKLTSFSKSIPHATN